MKQSKWFVVIYTLSCAGLLAVAFGINVLGNGTGLFPSSFFPATTERAWKTRRLDESVRDCRPPKVIILGSSRVMQLQPKYVQAVTGRTTFNYGVSGATPTDWLAQLRYLLKIGCTPESIILGIDENAFGTKAFSGDELFGHIGLFLEVPFPKNVETVCSVIRRCDIGTTRASLTRLLRRIPLVDRTLQALGRPGRPTNASPNIEEADAFFLEDGYFIYCHHMRAKVKGTFDLQDGIDKRVRAYGEVIRAAILKPDSRSQKEFEAFLSVARANGIEVRVFVTPFHPDFERQVFDEKMREARHQLRQDLRNTSASFGASFVDLSDVSSYEGDPNQFYDAYHQTTVNTQRMINVLFGLPTRTVAADLPTDLEIMANPPRITSLTKD